MADEALKCLNILLESAPGWIADLENILTSAAERQREILFEHQPADDVQPIDSFQDGPRKLSKGSSARSIQEAETAAAEQVVAADDGYAKAINQVQEQRPHMTPSDELRLAQRKRKTASVCSGREDGPHKYRSRGMVVIYYDGQTQKRFETMVRDVSGARSALRKGKMGARLSLMSRTHTGDPKDNSNSDVPLEMPRIAFRSTRQAPVAGDNDTKMFDQLDTLLEKAQMMCERAAHQVLRDGDCALEVKHAKQHFAEATAMAESELGTWRQHAEVAQVQKESSQPSNLQIDQDKRRASDQLEAGVASQEKRNEGSEPDCTPATPTATTTTAGPSTLSPPGPPEALAVDLEPDDSDSGGDEDFAIDFRNMVSPYSRRQYLTGAGVTAH